MKTRNKFIVTPRTALAQLEICTKLYAESIASVYDYANKVGLPYSECKGCEASTPTVVTIHSDTCAICGKSKEMQSKY